MVSYAVILVTIHGSRVMTEKTCAACDCELDENTIKVKVNGKIVEVCCEECAKKLGEAVPDNER